MDLSAIIVALIGGILQLIGIILTIKTKNKKWKAGATVFLVSSLILLLFGLFFITPVETTLKITYPLPATFASISVQVRGISAQIPAGERIWVVVYDGAQNDNRYYPNKDPATVQANGDWFDSANLGGANDVNWTFLIFVALVNTAGQDAINSYWQNNSNPGWPSLPDGITTYDLTAVIRGP